MLAVCLVLRARFAEAQTTEDLLRTGLDKRDQAVAEHDEAKLLQALGLFERARELERSGRPHGLLGLTEPLLKKWDRSEQHLNAALALTGDPWVEKNQNRVHLMNALNTVREHIGELTVAGTPAGAQVWVNGQSHGTLPLAAPIHVGEGESNVQVTAPGYQPFVRSVTVRGRRATSRLDVALEKVKTVEVSPIARAPRENGGGTEQSSPTPWQRAAGFALVGAGVLSMVGGSIYLVRVNRSDCSELPMGAMCNTRKASSAPGWALLGAGLAAGIGGGVMLYQNRTVSIGVAISPSVAVVKGSWR
jgi:hypothetical protein